MVETVNNSFRAAFDAGQRTQEAFFRASHEALRSPDVDRFFPNGDKLMKQWVGYVGRNMEAMADAVNANFRSAIDIWDVATRNDQRDVYERTRQMWDAAFEGARTNFDVATKAANRTMELFSSMCDCSCCGDERKGATSVPQSKPAKSNN